MAERTLVVGPALTTACKNAEKEGRDCEAEDRSENEGFPLTARQPGGTGAPPGL